MPLEREIDAGVDPVQDKKRLKQEKKRLKEESKERKKEAKKKVRELESQVDATEDADEHSAPVFLVTLLIVAIWIVILCILVKLDVGGFGSSVLTPILKDVPVLNSILPSSPQVKKPEVEEEYNGYKSLKEAVDQIKVLELELEKAQSAKAADTSEVDDMKAELERLRTFEDNQVEFQRIKTEFYEEVVYADNGPGLEAYQKYYESIDPVMAEELYKQVIQQVEQDKEIQDYAKAYSSMKPKEAAGIFEAMADNLDLAAKILGEMTSDNRGKILGAMDPEVAAKITKIMEPGI